eukprot:371858-Amphidinium_carterae.1
MDFPHIPRSLSCAPFHVSKDGSDGGVLFSAQGTKVNNRSAILPAEHEYVAAHIQLDKDPKLASHRHHTKPWFRLLLYEQNLKLSQTIFKPTRT